MVDNNYYSIADQDGITVKDITIDPRKDGINPATISDVFKFSHATNVVADNVTVDAGGFQIENTIDMNRLCANVTVKNCKLVSGMENAITIKGGCHDILIQDTVIIPGKGHCDVELGNWSDQSQEYVSNVTLNNVTRSDGQPVRLRVGHAKEPTIVGGNIKRMFWGSLLVKIYWQFKKLTK
jgi:polygalacturonase